MNKPASTPGTVRGAWAQARAQMEHIANRTARRATCGRFAGDEEAAGNVGAVVGSALGAVIAISVIIAALYPLIADAQANPDIDAGTLALIVLLPLVLVGGLIWGFVKIMGMAK